ncbi:MAG: GrpB family protein [Bacteriovorax sp.]|nr:GrpB family protein [Bacteriovorax sp.]
MHFLSPEEYQTTAQNLFDKIKKDLVVSLPYARIEHIGSSSIEGLISKGNLDIYVEVEKLQFDESIEIVGMSDQVKTSTNKK